MGNVAENLAKNLTRNRKEKGWTQDMLAEFAGLSQNAIAQIEGGKRWPERETITKLATALGIDEEELFLRSWDVAKPSRFQIIEALANEFGIGIVFKKPKKKG